MKTLFKYKVNGKEIEYAQFTKEEKRRMKESLEKIKATEKKTDGNVD